MTEIRLNGFLRKEKSGKENEEDYWDVLSDLNSGSCVYMYVKIHQAVQLKYVSLLTVVYMMSAFSELCSPLGFVLNWW